MEVLVVEVVVDFVGVGVGEIPGSRQFFSGKAPAKVLERDS